MRTKSSSAKHGHKVFSRAHVKPVSHGHKSGIRPAIFYGCFAALFATNIATLVGFLMAPDISALLNVRMDSVVSAYEDRISQLRVEVDRLHSRQYAQTGDINLQLQEVTQQQELLLEQHQLVKQLAQKANELGIDTENLPDPGDAAEATPLGQPGLPTGKLDLAQVAASMTSMMDDSRLALATLNETATESTAAILGTLGGLGIKPKMPQDLDTAVGGPLLPAVDGPDDSTSIVDDANEVYLALARFKAARGAIDMAPIHRPMDQMTRVSSGFGNRTDPFTGGRAYHAGLDFPAPKGTIVLSAGYGQVTFVGERSGYGNTVEITHGSGLVTRYGHLSAFLVKQGQVVDTGTPIARVGSTGRSTGPHLHFEVRQRDVAVDPGKYLSAGKTLARFLGA